MNKNEIIKKWILLLYISIIILFNIIYIISFYLSNINIIYVISILNIIIMLFNVYYVKKIIYSLLNEKNKWEYEATYDSLTGILNRSILFYHLAKEIKKSHRYNTYVSLIIFDLDYFKNINDTYGHPVGDITLNKICSNIKNIIRDSDYFGRLGGDEFGIILPETNISNAFQLAERIRKTIEDVHIKNEFNVTASIGVSILKKDDTVDSFYERTDKASYISKSTKNKVSVL